MERVVKERMSLSEVDSVTPQSLTNIRPLTAAMKEFLCVITIITIHGSN